MKCFAFKVYGATLLTSLLLSIQSLCARLFVIYIVNIDLINFISLTSQERLEIIKTIVFILVFILTSFVWIVQPFFRAHKNCLKEQLTLS